jgi:hypothetical protein
VQLHVSFAHGAKRPPPTFAIRTGQGTSCAREGRFDGSVYVMLLAQRKHSGFGCKYRDFRRLCKRVLENFSLGRVALLKVCEDGYQAVVHLGRKRPHPCLHPGDELLVPLHPDLHHPHGRREAVVEGNEVAPLAAAHP